MSKTIKINNCTICGSSDEIFFDYVGHGFVYCKQCGVEVSGKNNTLESALEMWNLLNPEWISVDERLPDVNIEVLTTNGKSVCLAYYDGVLWSNLSVTHWMPVPELPKER